MADLVKKFGPLNRWRAVSAGVRECPFLALPMQDKYPYLAFDVCLEEPSAMRNFHDKKHYRRPANPQGKSTAAIPPGGFCCDCPYRRRNPQKPPQEDGFCSLLDIADWHRGEIGLVWDGVKICGYNLDRPRLRFGQRRLLEAILARPSLMTLRKPFPSLRGPGWRTKFRDAA